MSPYSIISSKLGRVAEAMTMGVSTQRNPFKLFIPSPIWFSQHSLRSPFIMVSSSLHPFSTSLKAFHRHRLVVEQNAHSWSTARMRPAYIDKRNRSKCYHEQLDRDLEDVQPSRSSVYRNPGVTYTGTKESSYLWLEKNRKLKEGKMASIHGQSKRLPDGSNNENINLSADFSRGSRVNNISIEEASQSSSVKKYLGYDQETRKSCTSIPETSSGGAPDVTRCSHASQGMLNVPRLRSQNSIAEISRYNPKPDQLMQAESSLTQLARNDVQSNELSSGKPSELSKQKLSELPGDRPYNSTEGGSSNGKSRAISNELKKTRVKAKMGGEGCATSTLGGKNLCRIYEKTLVVDNISDAKKIVEVLTTQYKDLVHACDTEVAKINVKKETPVDHGELICFSIYSGGVDFGNGKSFIWVDVLDGGGMDLLMEFAPFFEDPSIKKVWHNYSFDSHIIENYGIKISGFHADTIHMARLWDSSRQLERKKKGGYSLEALTRDPKVMSGSEKKKEAGTYQGKQKVMSGTNQEKREVASAGGHLIGKISMKTIFGKRKLMKDGCEGKDITLPPVEELQREERISWICYSTLDSMSTLNLFESLKAKLMDMKWLLYGCVRGSMYDFYEQYWRPFGQLLVKMETAGMLVDRAYLVDLEKVATEEQKGHRKIFREWASQMCPDALYMNVGSAEQLRQLFFVDKRKNQNKSSDLERTFKLHNEDKVTRKGEKVPKKNLSITLKKIGGHIEPEIITSKGLPSVSRDALKILAGNVSPEFDWNLDTSSYGTAYDAFGKGKEGREACHAIAALREDCSIESLINKFIKPLQASNITGKDGRVHCSLNINTETGRLSAKNPSLQNQPALEKDKYKIRQAFVAAPGNSLVVADYGQLELRILAHLANCTSMLEAFKAGGDFHSRTAMTMYPHILEAVEKKQVLLEWQPQPGEEKPPVPQLKVSVKEAKNTVNLWYKQRQEVLSWQEKRKKEAREEGCVYTLFGRARRFSKTEQANIERAAINTPVQGSAADVVMCAMLEISRNPRLTELGWRLLLQVHDELILEGPTDSAQEAKAIVVECMSKPFDGANFLKVDLPVDAKCVQNWYAAK